MKRNLSFAGSLLVTALMIAPAQADRWYWVPSQITNAQTGDAILTASTGGVIATLLGSLGQYWSHSGMFIDFGYDIRHNTADPNAIHTIGSPLPSKLNSGDLYAMKPGLITQGVPEAFGDKGHAEFNFFDLEQDGTQINRNAVLLKRRGEALPSGASPIWAGPKMLEYEAMYSFYSYTDIWTTEPDDSDPDHLHVAPNLDRRNMCAGTVAWALFSGGGFAVWPVFYPEDMRNQAAPVLYNSIYDMVGGLVPGTNIPVIGGIVRGLASGTRSNIANQIVNCMAFEACDDTGTRWQGGVGSGQSLSPDNLLPVGFVNPRGTVWGFSGWDPSNPETIWYDSVEGLAYTGGYWKKY